MKYFLHDSNAFNDEKITSLFIRFGYEGLGLFYTILEKLAQQEKPVNTDVLKHQLKVGKKLEKCWKFMEEIGLISSNNGDTFNKQLLNFSEKYKIKKEKNAERISEWRKKQEVTENVTHYESVCNSPKVKESKVKEIKEENKDAEIVKLKDIPEGLTIPKKLEDIKFPFDSPEFNHAWLSWLSYRKESKIKAYQPVGLQHALSHLSNLAGGDEKKAIKIIQLSIANGWQGFFKLNEDKPLNRALTPADGDAYFKRAIV